MVTAQYLEIIGWWMGHSLYSSRYTFLDSVYFHLLFNPFQFILTTFLCIMSRRKLLWMGVSVSRSHMNISQLVLFKPISELFLFVIANIIIFNFQVSMSNNLSEKILFEDYEQTIVSWKRSFESRKIRFLLLRTKQEENYYRKRKWIEYLQ